MNVKYDMKKIIEHNRYAILVLYPFDNDPCAVYYTNMGSTCYDMFLLSHLLGHLRIKYNNLKTIVHDLQIRKFISTVNDLEYYAGNYDSKRNILLIHGEYADYQDQAYFEKSFPQEKSKDFLEYEYPISLDNFLDLAEKMKLLFDLHTHWVILYEDEFGKLHLEQYDKKIDYL